MRRRFLGAMCIGAALPFVALAQSRTKPWRIAFIERLTAESWRDAIGAFKKAFAELGYAEGVHYQIEGHYSGDVAALPRFARDVVASDPDLILTWSTTAAIIAKEATSRIPIVFMSSGDPVGSGLVKSLARPGGNVTGFSNLLHEIVLKQFDLLREALPQARHVAALLDSQYASHRAALSALMARAPQVGVKVLVVEGRSAQDIDRGFESIAREKAQAVLVFSSPFFGEQHEQIVALSHRLKIPCVGDSARGWLVSYWVAFDEPIRRSAELVHKVLQGAKPAELPVAQPSRFRLSVDLKAARATGVEVPRSLLLQADRVLK